MPPCYHAPGRFRETPSPGRYLSAGQTPADGVSPWANSRGWRLGANELSRKVPRRGRTSRGWRLAVGQLPGKVPLDPLPDAHPPTYPSNGPTGKWLGGVAARSSAGTRTARAATLRATDEHLSALHKLASARASRQDYSCTLSASERLTLRMARICKHATTKYVRNPMPTSRAIRLIGSSITKLPE